MNAQVSKYAGGIAIVKASGAESEALLGIFEQIAAEEGWQPQNALRDHPRNARYLAAWIGEDLAGGLQVIIPSADCTLPHQSVWPEVTVAKPAHTAHITVLALQKAYRGNPELFWTLCVELWRFLVTEGMEAVLLEATVPMLRRYRRLGFPLETIGELRSHWGEDCYLCRMDLRTVAGAMLMQARRSPAYRTLIAQAARSILEVTCPSASTLP